MTPEELLEQINNELQIAYLRMSIATTELVDARQQLVAAANRLNEFVLRSREEARAAK